MHSLRKFTFALVLFALFCQTTLLVRAAAVTSVTVSANTYNNWRYGGTTAKIRVYASNTFTQSGTWVIGSARGSGQWYQQIDCTVSGTVLSIPSFTLQVTTTSSDSASNYTFVFVDSKGTEREVYLGEIKVPDTFGANVTWDQLYLFNTQRTTRRSDYEVYNKDQVNALMAQLLGVAGGELAGAYPNPTVVTGTTANKIVRLDGSARLPAVDGSLLTNIGSASLSFTFGATDLWDNAYWIAQSGFNQHSSMARAVFLTQATSVQINIYQNGGGGPAVAVQVWVNGAVYATPNVPNGGAQTITQALPAGTKVVALVAGTQGIATPVGGAYLVGCVFNAMATEVAPQQSDRLVVYGDSISQGGGGSPNLATAWPTYYRAMTSRSVTLEAYSGRSLFSDCDTSPHCTTFVTNQITPAKPTTMWIEIGTNDYNGSSWNAASFGTAYANLLDTLHSQLPGLTIYCQTPTLMTSPAETANGFSNLLEDYRTQIRTVVSARLSFVRIVEGPDILTQADLIDGIHPNDAGNKKFAFYVYRTLAGLKDKQLDFPDVSTTENVVWANAVNVSVAGNTITKNAGGAGFNAGATSTRSLLYNDQSDSWIRWTVSETNTIRVVGLEATHIGQNFPEILFGHAPQTSATLALFESGSGLFSGGTVIQAGDILQLRIRPPKLYYERIRNGVTTLLRVSPQTIVPSMFPMFIDTSMQDVGSTVTNAQIHGILQ